MKELCATCKYFEQGKTCSFCGNKKQADKDLKEYLHWSFKCELHEKGTAKSRIDYMQNIKMKNLKTKI